MLLFQSNPMNVVNMEKLRLWSCGIMTFCSLVGGSEYFVETSCLHLHGGNRQQYFQNVYNHVHNCILL